MVLQEISTDAILKKGDRLLLKYDARPLGPDLARWLANFFARFNHEKPVQLLDFSFEGNPVFNPADGTLNFLVRVEGTVVAGILLAIAKIMAVLGPQLLMLGAFLFVKEEAGQVVEKTGEAVGDIGSGLKIALPLFAIAVAFLFFQKFK